MTSLYDELESIFDYVFLNSGKPLQVANQPIRFNKAISSSQFPPTNILCGKTTKQLQIVVALAGYKEEDINLSFDGDNIRLEVNKTFGESKEDEEEILSLQRGIKLPGNFTAEWAVDLRYYDRESTKVTFEDGLLTITINPRTEVAPKKIQLFGKPSEKITTFKKPENEKAD